MDSLTDHDVAIFALERQFWKTVGAKEEAIRDQLGMTPTRYYQRLRALINTEAALAQDPVVVNRLKRIATARRACGADDL